VSAKPGPLCWGAVLTDASENELEWRSYDAFGARRNPIWGAPSPASFPPGATPGSPGLVHSPRRAEEPRKEAPRESAAQRRG